MNTNLSTDTPSALPDSSPGGNSAPVRIEAANPIPSWSRGGAASRTPFGRRPARSGGLATEGPARRPLATGAHRPRGGFP